MASPTPIGTNGTFTEAVIGTTSSTYSGLTVPSSGQNRGLVVLVCTGGGNGSPGYISSMTWDGVGMTKDVAVNGVQRAGGMVYSLANPNTGNKNLVINYGTAPGSVTLVAVTFQDFKQTSPLDTTGANANSAGSTSQTDSVTTGTDNSVVIAWAIIATGATSITPTSGTSLGNFISNSLDNFTASYIPKATAGSQSETFNWTGSVANDMFITSYKYVAPTIVANTNFFDFFQP